MTSDGWIVSDWATDANTWSGTARGRGRVEVGKLECMYNSILIEKALLAVYTHLYHSCM